MLSTYKARFFIRHVGKCPITTFSHNLDDGSSKLPKPFERPVRGGQNLSERFKRLENSLRGKNAMKRELAAKGFQTLLPPQIVPPATVSSAQAHRFHGFHVPLEPKPPADDECCMSGCAVCVYDLYEESLAAYKNEVDALRIALTGMKIPELKWPAHIRFDHPGVGPEVRRNEKSLSAFEEMERGLALKKQQIEKD